MTCGHFSPLNPIADSFLYGSSLIHLLAGKSRPDSRPEGERKADPFPEYKAGSETILFVEDLESLRTVIADSLEQLGYQVLTAASGEDALMLSSHYKGEIHLLLTDVIMPQMKGPELAKKLQADRPKMKVIYVSGYPDGVLAPHGVLAPGTVLINKPFSIKVLSTKLREVLGD